MAITTIGAVVLVLGLLSGLIRPTFLSEPMLALIAGVLLGPAVGDVLEPARWGDSGRIVERAALLTMAIGVMAVALRLPARFTRDHLRTMLMLLVPIMLGMWLISGALVWAMLGVGWLTALVIGAVITPTDPVLATAIVTGSFARDHLPARLRHIVSAESGANDGLAVLVVMLPLLLLMHRPEGALAEWALRIVLWQAAGSVVLGWLLGKAAGLLLDWAEAKHAIETTPLLAYSLALSLVALGLGELLGMTGILAVFAAGRGFVSVVSVADRQREQQTQEAVNRFFLLPIFVLLGLVLPWDAWAALGWPVLVLAALVLLVRRLPMVVLLSRWMPGLHGRPEAWFAGWFGPIGIAALYYAHHVGSFVPVEHVWPVASLVVVMSTVVHGVTAAPCIRLYDRVTGYASTRSKDDR